MTRRQIYRIFATLLMAWLLVNAASMLRHIVSFYTPLPIRDYWRVVDQLPDYQAFHLSVLWKQHNEHRIVFPEAIFATDMLLARGRMVVPLVVSTLCYIATWAILSFAVLTDGNGSKLHRWISVLISGVLAFFETVAISLAAPFLLVWTLTQVAAASSIMFLSRLKNEPSVADLWSTIAMAMLATYSCAGGLALWPLIIFVGWMFGLNKRYVATLTAAAAVNFALYFAGYHFPPGRWGIRNLASHPIFTLGFVASYLSVPIGSVKAPAFGVVAGLTNLLLAATCFLLAWKEKRLGSRAPIVLFSYYLFTLLCGVITATARLDTADPAFFAAKQVRYISMTQMNWAALLLIVLWTFSAPKYRRFLPALYVFFSLGCLVAFIKLDRWVAINGISFQKEQEATRSIESGTMDRDLIVRYVYPDFHVVVAGLSRLRAARLSIYCSNASPRDPGAAGVRSLPHKPNL